jgi:tetratricopeptide (TPR) repeat protein
MKKVDFSYFIERYNAGDMENDEKSWFEKELEGNQKLQNEVDLSRKTDEILKNQDILSLRRKLMEIERKRSPIIPIRFRKSKVYIRFAAVAAILILVGSITLFTGKPMTSDQIIDRYYKAYEPPTTLRSGIVAINNDFTLALKFYNTRDYEKAAALFNKVLISNPRDMQSALLNGVSNFEDKKYPDAKESFVSVINDNNNLFIETAKWYLALCYVKTNEKDKAIKQLEMIRNDGGIYKNDAKKIIRKMK